MAVDETGNASCSGSGWEHYKIVERKESGYLDLNEENLKECVGSIKKDLQVVLLAVIGPPASGASFYTNLIMENLEAEGKSGWMFKFTKQGNPLTGFAYGQDGSRVTNGCREPDTCSSGIYMRTHPFLVNNQQQQVYILHVDYTPFDEWRGPLDSLHVLLTSICSVLVEIKRGEEKGCQLLDMQKILGRTSLPKSISIVIQAEGKKEADKTQENIQKGFINRKDINFQFIHRPSQSAKSLHDANGILTLPTHRSQLLSTCIDHIVGRKEVVKFQSAATLSDLSNFILKRVKEVNGNSKVKKWEWCADRVAKLISQIYPYEAHVEVETRLQTWLLNNCSEDLTQMYNQGTENLVEKAWRDVSQSEPDRVETMSKFKNEFATLMAKNFQPFITGIQTAISSFQREVLNASAGSLEAISAVIEKAISSSMPPGAEGTPMADVITRACKKVGETWKGKCIRDNFVKTGELVMQLLPQYPFESDEDRNHIYQQLGTATGILRRTSSSQGEVQEATELITNIIGSLD